MIAEQQISPLTPERTRHVTAAQRANKAPSEELPEGSIHFQDFLDRHNLKPHRRKIANYLDTPSNGLHYEAFPGRTEREKERYWPVSSFLTIEYLDFAHFKLKNRRYLQSERGVSVEVK